MGCGENQAQYKHERGMAAQVLSSPSSFLLLLVQEHQQGPEDQHHRLHAADARAVFQ